MCSYALRVCVWWHRRVGARCCGAASSEDDRAGTDVACSFPPTLPSTCVCVRGGWLVATRGRGAAARARRQVVGAIRCSRLLPPMLLLYILLSVS